MGQEAQAEREEASPQPQTRLLGGSFRAPSSLTASPPELQSSPGLAPFLAVHPGFCPIGPAPAPLGLSPCQTHELPALSWTLFCFPAAPCTQSPLHLHSCLLAPWKARPSPLLCEPHSSSPALPAGCRARAAQCPRWPESPLAGLDPRTVTVSGSISKWQINLTASRVFYPTKPPWWFERGGKMQTLTPLWG